MTDSQTDFHFIHHRKPDLLIRNRQTMKSFIVEISCPYDAFLNTCYNTKFAYYQPLNELINVATPYSCKTIVLIVGSLGTIHNRLASGLKMLGFPNRRCKAITNYTLGLVLPLIPTLSGKNALGLFVCFFPTNGMLNFPVCLSIVL